ncbi:hypothetical protein M406DRAFT_274896 [Cryphonectria parasitica EP155]|uniref:F-box domain-containing protein n=1 Tax=Cryphonectria parasitica (strain ATCC 38755 / EP155) TaxID=660469 RepID=A0A9P4Y5L9_CRYP1|nr:uncharacterized protein M406DRAFT_274896 [Cryphonectria parasitica EP155]KAF3767394.1 hypothetical protein M406DRAFT_274896 [Cryphonectria parasitica EP155]
MESLPVELVRLVYGYCDSESIKALRLQSRVLGAIGLEYLVNEHVNVLSWKMSKLHAISKHEQLKNSITSVTLNFTEVDEYTARHASIFQHYLEEPAERNDRLALSWAKYYEADKRRKVSTTFDSRPELVLESFRNLPNFTDLEVTFTKCPFNIDVLQQVFNGLPSCRKMDREQAAKNLALIASALKETNLSSLTIDRFPLEILRLPDERRRWFDCVSTSFSRLSSLHLTVDPSALRLPAQRFKAIKGLGSILRCATNITSLSLTFHTYGMPKHKFIIWFDTLLEGFTFEKLSDLKLEGISCDEDDLRDFILRHASTLERLRLGGRGLAKAFEGGLGGIHLCRGTFRGLFAGLRNKLPKLERVHLEGDFECVGVERSANEAYSFHRITDDNWEAMEDEWRLRRAAASSGRTTRDCLDFERYLLQGGKYPGSATGSPAVVAPAQ